MSTRTERFLLLGWSLLCVAIGAWVGETYIGRLPHHAGYRLVPVEDRVAAPPRPHPRAFLVVVDGLRRAEAEAMASTAALAKEGQCRVSDQGSLTVSRPVYTLLSAGIEIDRSGVRNNDEHAPASVESVWEVAREAGLRVSGSSHLPWFEELFPRGFDHYRTLRTHEANVFDAELVDVNLFHPLYVDEAGHEKGAASPMYKEAVARADREISALLARVDLARDVVILTADHGHRDKGGHGGVEPEIENVLVCFAGPNVQRRTDRAPFDGRVTAPALAALVGLRFPRHMRAGEDGLDAIFEIVKADEPYIADRRAAVERFRAANRTALEGWLGGAPGTWSRLEAREARWQHLRAAAVAIALAVLVLASFRARKMDRAAMVRTVGWLVFSCFAIWAMHHLVLGDFSFTVINMRYRFVPRAGLIAGLAALVAYGAHFLVKGRVTLDWITLLVVLVALDLGHVVAYGWTLGYPMPPPAARYWPFFGGIALAMFGVAGVGILVLYALSDAWTKIKARRSREAPRSARP